MDLMAHGLVYVALLVAAEVATGSPDRQAESQAAWLWTARIPTFQNYIYILYMHTCMFVNFCNVGHLPLPLTGGYAGFARMPSIEVSHGLEVLNSGQTAPNSTDVSADGWFVQLAWLSTIK